MTLKEIFLRIRRAKGSEERSRVTPAIHEGQPPSGEYLRSFEAWIAGRSMRLRHNIASGWMTEWDLLFVAEPPVSYHLEYMPVKKSRVVITLGVPDSFGKSGLEAVAAAAQQGLFGGAPMKPTGATVAEGLIAGSYSVDPMEVLRRVPA